MIVAKDLFREEAFIKTLAKQLLWIEPFLLLALVYFFWYPSSFPASSNGIQRAEWLWLVEAAIPLLILYWIARGDIHIVSLRQSSGWLIVPLAGLLLLWNILYPIYSAQLSTDIDRADYISLLALLLPVLLLRFLAYRRLWTITPLDGFLLIFVLLCLLNVKYAPYEARGWRMIARPLLGIALVIHFGESARVNRRIDGLLWILIALAGLVGWVALSATHWTSKSGDFNALIDRLPHLNFFFAPGGFNPNEIAGAIAWLTPLMAGLIFYRPPFCPNIVWRGKSINYRLWVWRGATGGAFLLLLLALLLGQSRAAIIGVLVALLGIALYISQTEHWRWRYLLPLGVILLAIAQMAYLFGLFPQFHTSPSAPTETAATGLSARDERTLDQRFAIWESAGAMVRDHPWTGVGLSCFRLGTVRHDYPVSGYENVFTPQYVLPHAHNELIQIATDLGLPGLGVFIGWNAAAVYMLWVSWQRSNPAARIVAVATAGGLLAHFAYGMADAIPLWDRFSFIYWLLLGLAAAQYTLVQKVCRNC